MNKNPIEEAEFDRHASYGAITIGRLQSGEGHPMYGSSVKHRNTIRLTVHHGERKRMLSGDWYYAGNRIVEVEMTQNQWAELVSSIGMGEGIPCTIRWLNGPVEEPPFQSKVTQFQDEFQRYLDDAVADADAAVKKMEELLEKKSITRADRSELLELVHSVQKSVKGNAPFVYRQFVDQIEKTSTEVKGELDAWQTQRLLEQAAMHHNSCDFDELPY